MNTIFRYSWTMAIYWAGYILFHKEMLNSIHHLQNLQKVLPDHLMIRYWAKPVWQWVLILLHSPLFSRKLPCHQLHSINVSRYACCSGCICPWGLCNNVLWLDEIITHSWVCHTDLMGRVVWSFLLIKCSLIEIIYTSNS